MSENGEIYTAGKNFTLPPALTAWTNSTSDKDLDNLLIIFIIINNAANIGLFSHWDTWQVRENYQDIDRWRVSVESFVYTLKQNNWYHINDNLLDSSPKHKILPFHPDDKNVSTEGTWQSSFSAKPFSFLCCSLLFIWQTSFFRVNPLLWPHPQHYQLFIIVVPFFILSVTFH